MIGHYASIFVLVMTSEFPIRTYFLSSILLGIILFDLLSSWMMVVHFNPNLFLKIGILIFFVQYSYVIADLHHSYIEESDSYKVLRESTGEKVHLPVLSKPLTTYNAYNGTNNLGIGTEHWFNKWMSAYFGIESIEGIENNSANY